LPSVLSPSSQHASASDFPLIKSVSEFYDQVRHVHFRVLSSKCAVFPALTAALQLKRDATPQVYQRFALLCRQYLEKREKA
jgi:hypothetical protein